MLLAIDIGNTTINFGIFKGQKLIKKFLIPTAAYSLKKLKNKLGRANIDDALICSVVPKVTPRLKRDFLDTFGRSAYIIGKEFRVPMQNLYRKPRQVGQDRLVNAYAATVFFGCPSIVIDFGTAVTFDVISRRGQYLGGMILPGLAISLNALAERTALLPRIKLNPPSEFIGRDTENSMLSGIVYGFAALSDDLAVRIKEKIGRQAKVIGTGGNINLIAGYCRKINKIDQDLTLKGINLIYLGVKK